MVVFEEMRRAVKAAASDRLGDVAMAIWKAYGAGGLTDEQAEHLDSLLATRRAAARAAPIRTQALAVAAARLAPAALPPPRGEETPPVARYPRTGSRPRSAESLARRRRWAASGRIPPALAARFTLAEQAVLALVAAETTQRGDCRLAVGHLAAIVGVAETTVRNAIREARTLGLVTVEERRLTGFRNDTNIVRIVALEWTAWLRLARKAHPSRAPARPLMGEGGGCKFANRTDTQILIPLDSRITQPFHGCRKAAGDLDRAAPPRFRQGGGKARAMR